VLSAAVGRPGVSEADIRTTCPSCGRAQRLDEALYLDEDRFEAFYRCATCTEPILVVSSPTVVPWEGRGTRIRDWMIRNPSDMFIRVHQAADETRIPAAPHALD
jgi:hypothetical protein